MLRLACSLRSQRNDEASPALLAPEGLVKWVHIGFFKILFIYFLERGGGREREREGSINVWLPLTRPLLGTWPATQACALNW